MKKYNKTTAAVLSGAVVAVIGGLFEIDPETLAGLQTVITAALVWLVPNVT